MALRFVLAAFLTKRSAATTVADQTELLQKQRAREPEPWQQELHNFKDVEYEAEIQVGQQTMRAIFDTGSFEMVVVSTRCASSDCAGHERAYDPYSNGGHKDMKWKKKFSYGSGWVNCRYGEDEVKVGPFEPIRQGFWEVRDSDMRILQDKSFEIILGLGNPTQRLTETRKFLEEDAKLLRQQCPDGTYTCPDWLEKQKDSDTRFLSVQERHPPLLQNMGSKFFSVCMQPEKGSSGFWTWHEKDPSQFGRAFQTVQVTGIIEWKTDLNDVYMRGGAAGMLPTRLGCGRNRKCAALFDTGTSLISAPTDHVRRLNDELSKLGGSCANITKMPSIVLSIDGKDIILPPSAYIMNVTGKVPAQLRSMFPQYAHGGLSGGDPRPQHKCSLALIASDAESEEGYPLWLLGLPFFRHYFATFDVGTAPDYLDRKISLAPSDGSCHHPSDTQYMQFAKEWPTVRDLDISGIRVPNWLVKHAANRAIEEDDEDRDA